MFHMAFFGSLSVLFRNCFGSNPLVSELFEGANFQSRQVDCVHVYVYVRTMYVCQILRKVQFLLWGVNLTCMFGGSAAEFCCKLGIGIYFCWVWMDGRRLSYLTPELSKTHTKDD